MIKNKILATFLIGTMLLAACQQEAASTKLSAALSELAGKVDMKAAGADTFAPAEADSVLEVNGQVQTGDDGRVRLDLSTGTIIRIAYSSSFTLTSNEDTEGGLLTKIKLEAGKIFIILNGGRAEVETPSGVASVRGSYMKVEVEEGTGDVYVTCLEGNCSAQNPAGGVEFTQGQKTILFHKNPSTGNWTIPGVEDMTPEDFQEWLDNNPEAKALYDQAMGTATALANPTATETPANTPTAEPTIVSVLPSGDNSTACKTINPPAGASLEHLGKVKFEWEPQQGAKRYVVTFTTSNGTIVTFETTETSIEKYIEIFPAAGDYKWDVTAYGENEEELCQSETITFDKPDSKPAPPKKEEESGCSEADYCNSGSPCFDYDLCFGSESN